MSYDPNYLNNNDVDEVINSAYEIATGKSAFNEDGKALTLKGIIDAGSSDGGALAGKKEQFTKALISMWARNFYTDTRKEDNEDDPYYVDSRQWGAIVQMISAQAPAVQESHAWRQFVSGTSTVGTYTVYLPIVSAKYYGKSISWELPITISYEQYADAFKSADGFNEFRAYIFTVLENAITQHRKNMNNANRNNFIAEKYLYQNTVIQQGEYYFDISTAAAATDVITICGKDITWVASEATGDQINLPGTNNAANEAAALVAFLNASTDSKISAFTWSQGTTTHTNRVIAKQDADAVHAVPVTAVVDAGETMVISAVTESKEIVNPQGVHVLNLRSMYNAEMSPASSVASAAAFMADKECLRYMSRKMAEYAGYMLEQSVLFNTEQKVKFVPRKRLVVEILGYAEQAANSILQSDTFHDMYTKLPNHYTVSAWEGLGDGENNGVQNIAFSDVSRINVKVDDGSQNGRTVNITGVVGFIADKYAILHTIRSTRVGAQSFDIDAVDHYAYQFRDQYMNNLTQNAIVFVVD